MRQIRGNQIAMIFQDPMTSLNPVLTIGRQITEALELHLGMNKAAGAPAQPSSCWRWSASRRPPTRLDDYPHQFSGGMRQRVMIAMALCCNPQLLIADEPTTALDVTIQAQIVDLVKRLRDEIGMAIIWITHDLGVVAGLADRVHRHVRRLHRRGGAGARACTRNPRHPYTLGLLGSMPRLDEARGRQADPDRGAAARPDRPAAGLPLLPALRLPDRSSAARKTRALELVAPDHRSACWVDVTTAKPTR